MISSIAILVYELPHELLNNLRISNFSFSVQFYWVYLFCSKYFAQDCRFNSFLSSDNLLRKKDGLYHINRNGKKTTNTLSFIIFWQKYDCVLWFFWGWTYSTRRFKRNKDKSITYSVFRKKADDSIMCGFYGIAFIEYILERKT